MSTKARVLAKLAELGASFDWEDHSGPGELMGTVEAPDGKVWRATGCHGIAVDFWTDRTAGWRSVWDDITSGLDDCDDPDCEICLEKSAETT